MKHILLSSFLLLLFFGCNTKIKKNNELILAKKESDNVILDFKQGAKYGFKYFSNGHLGRGKHPFTTVDKGGRNAGEVVRASDASSWSGMYSELESPIYTADGKRFLIDVWMDHLGSFTLKLEKSTDGGQNTALSVKNTKINEWETLLFDFEDAIHGGPSFTKIAIFIDLNSKATGKDVYSYFSRFYQIPSEGEGEIFGDKDKAIKIVVLGSSTAAGTGPSDSRNAWVNRYRRKLKSYNGHHQVINLAVGGYTTYHLLPTGVEVPTGRPAPSNGHNTTAGLSHNPDAVLINLPSNDVNLGFSIEDQLANYRLICQPFYDRNIPVWVSTPQGRNFDKPKRLMQKLLNDSTHIKFGRKTLDFWKGFAHWDATIKKELDSGDGIHMNDEAHRMLFEEVWNKDILGFILDKKTGIIRKDTAYTTPLKKLGYILQWNDEFDGDKLDMNSWSHELGDGCPDLCGWGNAEKIWYRPESSVVKNGKLIMNITEDPEKEGYWTASRIITNKKVDFRFGRIDVRAKLPRTKGLWPAIWLLGVNRETDDWPYCGEIDMMEQVGHIPHRIRGTLHYFENGRKYHHKGDKYELKYGEFSDDFHVYSIDWDDKSIKFYVDDYMYSEQKYTDLNLDPNDNPYLKPFYMILNCAVGGNLPGYPDYSSEFPQTFEVDYVRHYQSNKYYYVPKTEEKVTQMPKKENLWIYLMAGQSNMEGQGIVSPDDTIPNDRFLTMNKKGEWIKAKEPLHFHNTGHRGLTCGYSFGHSMLSMVPDSITIAVVPCALGGSSVDHWLDDTEYRNMHLWSNMQYKIADGLKQGVFKGMIWHQGETDAKEDRLPHYEGKLNKLYDRIRAEVKNPDMLVVTGELGKFESHRPMWIELNKILKVMAKSSDKNDHIITSDLNDNGDQVHFDTEAQRMMGKRYALKMGSMQGYGNTAGAKKLWIETRVK